MGKETDEVERNKKSELSIKNEFNEKSEENGNSEVRNWELMKRLMSRHFIPPDFRVKFYLKL